jgi:hypothetical protein
MECVCVVVARQALAHVLLFPPHNPGEVVMNHCHEPSRFRMLLLILALAAGGVATLFVPPYREIAFVPDDREAVTTPVSSGSASRGMTGIDVKMHHRNFVRNNG